jgi:hypothetical protein
VRKISPPPGYEPPDNPAGSETRYRLRYPGPRRSYLYIIYIYIYMCVCVCVCVCYILQKFIGIIFLYGNCRQVKRDTFQRSNELQFLYSLGGCVCVCV